MKILLYIGVFLVPFTNLSILASFTYSDVIFLMIFLLLLFTNNFNLNIKSLVYYIIVLVFITFNLIATFSSINIIDSIIRVLQYTFIFFVFMPVLMALVKNKKDIKNVLMAFYISGISIVLYTIIMYLYFPLKVTTVHGRVFSIYENPWIFSLFLIIILPLSLYFYSQTTKIKKKINLVIVFSVLYMIILAGARSSFVTIFLMLLFYIVNKLSSSMKNLYLKVIIYLLGSMIALISLINYKTFLLGFIEFISPISSIFAVKLSTFLEKDIDTTRVDMYKYGLNSISEHLLFGIGPGNFSELYGISMHNYFLSIWVESGLIAVFSIIFLYFLCIKSLFFQNNKKDHLVTLIIYLNVFHVLFMQFNPILTARLFWFPLVIGIIMANILNKEVKD